MVKQKYVVVLLMGLGMIVGLGGCGGGEELATAELVVDESMPLDEVQAMADKMDAAGLRDMALKHQSAIVAKNNELTTNATQMQAVPPETPEEQQAYQLEVSRLQKSIQNLTERYKIFYKKLQETGGDLTGLNPIQM